MTEAKRVSVVVPTRDRPELLREALQSIRALERDGVRFEIIVGDNGTSEDTRKVAEAFDAVYLHTSTSGAAAARNIAMAAATADYIAFLDDDDVWIADHIHGHLALLAANPDLDMVSGQIVNTDPQRRPIYGPWPEQWPENRSDLLRFMMSGYFPQIGATVVRARVARPSVSSTRTSSEPGLGLAIEDSPQARRWLRQATLRDVCAARDRLVR